MTRPSGIRRTKAQRERDLLDLTKLYLTGHTQAEAAAKIGIAQQQISRDLKELQRRWKDRSHQLIDDAKSEELAKIDQLERTYWEAWERSLDTRKIYTAKGQGSEGGDISLRTEDLLGDPRYLGGVQWCIDRRCRLLQLDPPTRQALTTPGGDEPYDPPSLQRLEVEFERRVDRAFELLERARTRRAVGSDPGTGST